MDTANLMERMIQQDPSALTDFYRQYKALILKVSLPMVRDPQDAEEVLQDVLFTVYRKAHTFQGSGSLASWVMQITRNASLMLMRKRKRIPVPLEDERIFELLDTTTERPQPTTPEQNLVLQRAVGRMHNRLHDMEPTNQQLYYRMEVEGLSLQDVAHQLGLSPSALKARLHRARRSLRASFHNEL